MVLAGTDPHGIGGESRTWKLIIVRVDTDEGLYGLGEAPHIQVSLVGVRDAINAIRDRIVGRDVRDIKPIVSEVLWGALPPHRPSIGLGAVPFGAIVWGLSGIEMALHDVVGKALGVPIWALLGGRYRDRAPIYLDRSAPARVDDLNAWAEMARDAVGRGFRDIKFDIDFAATDQVTDVWSRNIPIAELERIVARLTAVREAVGWDVEVSADCHMQYDAVSAIRLAQGLARLRLKWIEDPTPITHVDAMIRVRQQSPIPICAGEFCTAEQFRELIERGACDIVHPDVLFAGGLTETRRVADMAEAHGMPTALHNNSGAVGVVASTHVAVATRNLIGVEYHFHDAPWIGQVLDRGRPLFEDGAIVVTDAPGLGGVLNEKVCTEHLDTGEVLF
ncbi:MAG TPA: mandelate racemase/muconate lactonizing enzyme family protein [Candidatus Limnocylindria bacterium]|jgi:galactonate dehydratase|nr:mandelate racemase/muconate lactonizing enzyme family protein [Candidatus Limnocylindria bacterium]